MKGFQTTLTGGNDRIDNSIDIVASDVILQASNSNSDILTLTTQGGAIVELPPGSTLGIDDLGRNDGRFFLSKDWLVSGSVGDKLNFSYQEL